MTFYLIILGLAIPSYFIMYGASGHLLDIPVGEQLWLLFAGLSFILAIIYKRIKEKSELTYYVQLKILFGASLIGTFYGGLRVFLFMIHFDFGDDVGLMTLGVSYILPIVFMASCGEIFIGLFKIWSDRSATAGHNMG